MKILVLTSACLLLCACATEPQAPVAPPATAVPVVAAGGVPVVVDADQQAILAKARGLGYFPRQQNGTTVYCKRETPLGSRLPETTCVSADAIADAVRRAAETQQELTRARACSGGTACAGH